MEKTSDVVKIKRTQVRQRDDREDTHAVKPTYRQGIQAMSHFRLIAELERDIRNQVVIDQMKRLTPGVKFMIFARRYRPPLCFLALATAWTAFCIFAISYASATECPVPGESCKVLVLSLQEERLLTGQNGVLDTAAQARALDLG